MTNPAGYTSTKAIAETVVVGTDHSTATATVGTDDEIKVVFDNATANQYSSNNKFLAKVANTAPTANAQSVTTNEDTAKTITLGGSDADGNALTFSIVSGPTHGTLGSIGSVTCTGTAPKSCTADVTYTPAGDYNGPDSFTFKVNDGTVDSNTATVSITVTAVNDAPVASDGVAHDREDSAGGSPWRHRRRRGRADLLAVPVPRTAAELTGPYLHGDAARPTSPTPRPPTTTAPTRSPSRPTTARSTRAPPRSRSRSPPSTTPRSRHAQSVTTNRTPPTTITLGGSDTDGNALTFSIVSGPTHGTRLDRSVTCTDRAKSCTADVTYTPPANYNGGDSFTFKVNDGTVDSARGDRHHHASTSVERRPDRQDTASVTINEDGVTTVSDRRGASGSSDPNDSPANTASLAVKITTLPALGSLTARATRR